ncbi:MAG: Glutamyl-tRNA(Gln) amidotransferase subunit C [Chlamydiae bacterium]|nr:Glutamyl-tRNA(Gln) amidotransferase subunit C [Chlamydiota bacterium]
MSHIDAEKVTYFAKLARIAITKDEANQLQKDLTRVLDFVEQLDELDVSDTQRCTQVIKDHKHLMREDEVTDLLPRDVFLKNSPEHMGGLIKVPQIIIKD